MGDAEPFAVTRFFSFIAWLLIFSAVIGLAALFLRMKNPNHLVARLNATVGPVLFALAWFYGILFEPGHNFGAIRDDGFWGYWFYGRRLDDIYSHPVLFTLLVSIGLVLLVWLGAGAIRHRAAARGAAVPALALVLWCFAALSIYYVPWALADVITHEETFNHGSIDVQALVVELSQEGAALAFVVATISGGAAWALSRRSWRIALDAGDAQK